MSIASSQDRNLIRNFESRRQNVTVIATEAKYLCISSVIYAVERLPTASIDITEGDKTDTSMT